jgi:hypothetical protein
MASQAAMKWRIFAGTSSTPGPGVVVGLCTERFRVAYVDAFRKDRKTWFRYFLRNGWLTDCTEGNDWTWRRGDGSIESRRRPCRQAGARSEALPRETHFSAPHVGAE